MRKVIPLMAGATLAATVVVAQTRPITGRVTDDNGAAVEAATITVKGARANAVADATGNFRINAKTGDVLVITAVGFSPKEVTVGSGNTVSIRMSVSVNETAEAVVVTSLGQARSAKELGYATAKVKTAELTQAKVVNLQNGLTGKVSGLNIATVNNGVFANTRITLRGIRSLTGNNQPLLILDGVPVALGYINSINPNDVADVSILKSSSATAIYGPDGANGAIVITTRRGNRNRPSISVSSTTQLETVSYLPGFQTLYGSGSSTDPLTGKGVYDPIENQQYGPRFDGSMVQIGRDAPDGSKYMVPYTALPDEKRKFFNTGVTTQNDVSFSTGDFALSVQNVNIRGVLPKDRNQRNNVRLSAIKEYNKFTAQFNAIYTNSNYNVNNTGDQATPYWMLLNTPIHIPITRFKDWENDYWANPNGYFNDYYNNPYFAIDRSRAEGQSHDILGNLQLDYKPVSWLKITYRIGTSFQTAFSKVTNAAFNYSQFAKASGKNIAAADLRASVGDAESFSSRINGELFATMQRRLGKDFGVDVTVGHTYRSTYSKSVNVSSNNLGIPTVFNVSVRRGEPGASEGVSRTKLERFFGKVGFKYKTWAFIEGTASYDFDSRLYNRFYTKTKNDIGYFYPGVNASVVLSDAIPALKNTRNLSYLKVRGAISKTANVNLGAYSLENLWGPASGFPYNNLLGFTAGDVLRQQTYSPEFVQNKEVGLEVGFFKNRVNVEASYYEQDNTQQLLTASASAATGYPGLLVNAASFTNRGLELDLKLTPLVNIGKVTVDLKLNYTYQTNKVTQVLNGVDELGVGNLSYVIKGMPAYTFKMTDYRRDSLGRIIVNRNTGYPSVDPNLRTYGQTLPKHIFGSSLNVTWKDLTFSAVVDYRGGHQVYNDIGTALDFTGAGERTAQYGRMPFIVPNSSYLEGGKFVPNNSVYTLDGGYNFWSQDATNTGALSNYLTPADVWKLRELAISYVLPGSWVRSTRVIKMATVSLTGRNLFMWRPKTNIYTDPEFSNTTGNAQGVNTIDNTPPTRIYGFNVTLQF